MFALPQNSFYRSVWALGKSCFSVVVKKHSKFGYPAHNDALIQMPCNFLQASAPLL
jgi:hypothetical protein